MGSGSGEGYYCTWTIEYGGPFYKFFECGLSSEKSTNLVRQECVLALKVHYGWKELSNRFKLKALISAVARTLT